MIPDLVRLEQKYPNQLIVIGIHTPKFDSEKDPASIRKAMQRYERAHQLVINDADKKLWQKYGVASWPTVVLIDPEGFLVGAAASEKIFDSFDRAIGQLLKVHRQRRTLIERPLRVQQDLEKARSPLYFPGKVVADDENNRLFIADSTHHRIVITDLDGKKIAIAGTGKEGRADGPFDKASFADPQGMALSGDLLYVADRKNHMIRALDLKEQTVKTVAGTGFQGKDIRKGGLPLKVGLNSPWDLAVRGKDVFIAMAGHHQIWLLDLERNRVGPYAGNGLENIIDGTYTTSSFAQPSGLALDGAVLYVADSEASGIRAVSAEGKGGVVTIVGTGLFDFGDIDTRKDEKGNFVDGESSKVRLQHALGVIVVGEQLYVADTYNNKIKIIDPAKKTSTTFLGGDPKEPLFDEPGGLTYAGGGKIYVADTNAHRIRVIDIESKEVTTLKLEGVEPPAIEAKNTK